jgi:RND family efflux transporter MFP subunit
MKKILLLLTAVLIVSCGGERSTEDIIGGGDLKEIKAKRGELLEQKTALDEQIAALELYINEKSGDKNNALVSTLTIKDTLFNHYLELQGSVETKQNVVVYPEMPGVLTNVYVKEGQRVSKGQRLASIDDGGLSLQIQQMEVQAQLAKTTFERQKNLWNQKIGSEIQYLQAKAGYEAQQKAINSMRKQLGKSTVNAPFSGIVDAVITEQGSVVSPGATQLFRVVNLGDMYINVEVPENYITSIKQGTDVQVDLPVLNETLTSKVRVASSTINAANRSFSIEVPVPNKEGNVKPNLTAKLRINDYTNPNAILIPLSVISENQEGQQYVMIATPAADGKGFVAKKQIVTTGVAQGDSVEILTGLKAGVQVINAGARSVREDQSIDIKK